MLDTKVFYLVTDWLMMTIFHYSQLGPGQVGQCASQAADPSRRGDHHPVRAGQPGSAQEEAGALRLVL